MPSCGDRSSLGCGEPRMSEKASMGFSSSLRDPRCSTNASWSSSPRWIEMNCREVKLSPVALPLQIQRAAKQGEGK